MLSKFMFKAAYRTMGFSQKVMNRKGQGMVEWILIIVLIAVAVMVLLTGLGKNIGTQLQCIGASLTGHAAAC